MQFSIIIPVFNAASCLQKTIDCIVDYMQRSGRSFELILVDDGSRDNSWNIIKAAAGNNIKGIRLSKNYGQHNALLCGLNQAAGEYIVTMDDDMEHNPADIEKLHAALLSGDHELVYAMPSQSRKSPGRRFFTFIYKMLIRTENKKAGEGSSFRLFTKKLKDQMIMHGGSLFFLDEMASWYTDKIGYEKLNFAPSQKINSGYGYSSLLLLSMRVLSLGSTLPLRFVRVIGFNISLFSLLMAVYFIVRKMVFKVPAGYTSLMVIILFSTGVITFSLGIIGEYLGNLIALSNNKPSYVEKEKA